MEVELWTADDGRCDDGRWDGRLWALEKSANETITMDMEDWQWDEGRRTIGLWASGDGAMHVGRRRWTSADRHRAIDYGRRTSGEGVSDDGRLATLCPTVLSMIPHGSLHGCPDKFVWYV